jgi:hypothetical protein
MSKSKIVNRNRSCQKIGRLETLRIECRSLGILTRKAREASEMVKCARQQTGGEKCENADREKMGKTSDSDWLTVKVN